ncbi:GNS1/SUR4 family protein [Thecamonas trahens ATCC 50062]|uniref:Elongation of fatty acids protein n=1 Tax=Thecamonas trahens ATCC 50062 TaxID=461836 RepID=A0A0L0D7D7_THETB|nr:GNS1/SUR4 family protein [Thecamonas trahens ATCC 50062]KNC48302.1 GNS1/SUR4 family protein [Thecamonas trahens ATCC 50062]|eukprot:XP_013758869.1 GNS1/SUR4 family protein [Thecamonas trahens ATCC 50062]
MEKLLGEQVAHVLGVEGVLVEPTQVALNGDGFEAAGLLDATTFVWKVGTTPLAHPFYIVITWIIYLSLVFGLKAVVGSRWPTKYISAIHNLGLCLASAAMLASIIVWMAVQVSAGHWQRIFCWRSMPGAPGGHDDPAATEMITDSVLVYTVTMYYYSKWWELLDTVLLAVTLKPLIFLHVYHHCVVIAMVWMWLQGGSVLAFGLGAGFNTLVHVFMYYYYMQRSLGNKVWFKKHITKLQIIQFVSSFLLAIPYLGLTFGYIPLNKRSFPSASPGDMPLLGSPVGHQCSGWYSFVFSSFINASFLYLFVAFFRSTYNRRKKDKQA